MISSSRNPQKCCPSYFGEQSLMPCTLIFIPGLKSMQEDGQILPEVVHGMFRNLSFPYAFNGDGAETGHNLPFSSSASRRQRHERVNTLLPKHHQMHYFQLLSVFPYCQGRLCYHLPWHYSESPLTQDYSLDSSTRKPGINWKTHLSFQEVMKPKSHEFWVLSDFFSYLIQTFQRLKLPVLAYLYPTTS